MFGRLVIMDACKLRIQINMKYFENNVFGIFI